MLVHHFEAEDRAIAALVVSPFDQHFAVVLFHNQLDSNDSIVNF